MSLSFDKRLREILDDNQSGSRAITLRVNSLFRQLISRGDVDRSEIINRLRDACRKLEKQHSSLTSLKGLCDSVLLIVDTAPPREELIKRLNKLLDEWGDLFVERTTLQIASHLLQRLDSVERILLHSNSSTILNAFKHISSKNQSYTFIQTVAWPVREGVNMAKSLASLGYRVELISDAAVAGEVGTADVVLLGADSISEKAFINKTGSLAICRLAKEKDVPVYLIADSSKLVEHENHPEIRPSNPKEFMEEDIDAITVKNYYFETVPMELVTGILLQHGAYSQEGIRRLLDDPKKRKQKEAKARDEDCIEEDIEE